MFQTAVALAEYESEKDKDGKILVKNKHLKAVVELIADFKNYMYKMHRGDESKRAAERNERYDEYDSVD